MRSNGRSIRNSLEQSLKGFKIFKSKIVLSERDRGGSLRMKQRTDYDSSYRCGSPAITKSVVKY